MQPMPAHLNISAVRTFVNEDTGDKGQKWTKIGAAFPNRKGGFAIKLEMLPFDRTLDIVAMPPREWLEQHGPRALFEHAYLNVNAVRTFVNEDSGEKGQQWRKIGAAFPNRKGGFAIKLEMLPFDRALDIVAMPPLERTEDSAEPAPF